MTEIDTAPPSETCPRCQKSLPLCVCTGIEPMPTRLEVLILQHPQEQDRDLGTARLASLHLAKARLKIGLSWPNLSKLVGRTVDPKRWAVLYLGPVRLSAEAQARDLVLLDGKGVPLVDQDGILADLEGIVLLDGTWSQAKALWWRNAWMLKTRRLVLNPKAPSRYGRLRKEPRRDSVSTLEALGFALSRLEGRPEIEQKLLMSFDALLRAYRESKRKTKPSGPDQA